MVEGEITGVLDCETLGWYPDLELMGALGRSKNERDQECVRTRNEGCVRISCCTAG
jgi:hypothetical protein